VLAPDECRSSVLAYRRGPNDPESLAEADVVIDGAPPPRGGSERVAATGRDSPRTTDEPAFSSFICPMRCLGRGAFVDCSKRGRGQGTRRSRATMSTDLTGWASLQTLRSRNVGRRP